MLYQWRPCLSSSPAALPAQQWFKGLNGKVALENPSGNVLINSVCKLIVIQRAVMKVLGWESESLGVCSPATHFSIHLFEGKVSFYHDLTLPEYTPCEGGGAKRSDQSL